jgi:hypothetical protein
MPDYKDSKMMKNNDRNRQFIEQSRALIKGKRNAGITTRFQEGYKNSAKKFSFFRYITGKTDKVGRFGARKAAERNDVIRAIEQGSDMPQGAYFDPLGLKIIIPETVEAMGTDDEEGLQNDRDLAQQIEDSFVERVGDEIDMARENDFERHLIGDEKLSFGEDIENLEKEFKGKVSNNYLVEHYNAGQEFEPDEEIIKDVPDSFSIETVVDNPPPKYTLEWEMYKAEQTKGFKARVRNFFRSMFKIKEPKDIEIFRTYITTLPEYKEILESGRKAANDVGMPYDESLDDNMIQYKISMNAVFNASSDGHSSVRMNAMKNGKKLSVYSFNFGTRGEPGMAGATIGGVSNPYKFKGGAVSLEHPVSYPNFLKAAAKIRGIAGAMRSYSLMRYNCTSFAVDVASAAGIPFKAEDTSVITMSHRHRAQRLENPYTLVKYMERMKQKQKDEEEENAEYKENAVKDMDVARPDQLRQRLINKYKPKFDDNELIKILAKRNLCNKEDMDSKFSAYIAGIVESGAAINRRYRLSELEGAEKERAINDRKVAKIRSFGTESEEEAVKRLFRAENEDRLVNYFAGGPLTKELVKSRLLRNTATVTREGSLGGLIVRFREFKMFTLKYGDLLSNERTMTNIITSLLLKINNWQEDKTGSFITLITEKTPAAIVRNLDNVMGDFNAVELTNYMLENEESLKTFMDLSGITLPEDYEYDTRAAERHRQELDERQRQEEEKKRLEEAVKKRQLESNPEYIAQKALRDDKKEVLELTKIPSRLTRKQGIYMGRCLKDEDALLFEQEFIAIFKEKLGIAGKMKSSMKPVKVQLGIPDFFSECSRQSDTRQEVVQCYVDIAKSDSKTRCKELLSNLIRTIAERNSPEKLKEIFDESYIY